MINAINEHLIGRGSYGHVYMNSDNKTVTKRSTLVTCIINKNQIDEETILDFYVSNGVLREINWYKLIKRLPEVTSSTLGFPSSLPSLFLLTNINVQNNKVEFIQDYGGDILQSYPKVLLNPSTIFKDLLIGLYYIHSAGMSHGDIKSPNILINSEEEIHLIDFGSVCFCHLFKRSSQRCTITLVSPEEILNEVHYSSVSDIWSYGCVFFEYITKRCFLLTLMKISKLKKDDLDLFYKLLKSTPEKSSEIQEEAYIILKRFYKSISYTHISKIIHKYIKSKDQQRILLCCLLPDPLLRMTSKKLLEDPYWNTTIPPICSPVFQNLRLLSVKSICTKKQTSNRTKAVYLIYSWCHLFNDYGIELFSHSLMLFDRCIIRNSSYILEDNDQVKIIALLCILFSGAVLKDLSISGKLIYSIDSTYTIDIIKKVMEQILEEVDYQIYNASPDIILYKQGEYNRFKECDIEMILKLYIEYPILHQTSPILADKIKEITNK
jgi:serine/threonine protein kinase